MGSKGGGGDGIKIQPAKDYEKMIRLQLQYLPKQVQAELLSRAQYDPQFLQQALGLQHTYDPQLAAEQRAALERRDPQWLKMHGTLGDKIQQALERGYLDPRQEEAYQQLSGVAGKVDPQYFAMYRQMAGQAGKVDPQYAAAYRQMMGQAGKVDPRYEAAYKKLAGLAGEVDPRQEAAYARWAASAGKGEPGREAEYNALAKQTLGDTLRGGTMSPEVLRQTTQSLMARQPNLSYGEAQDMALAVGQGLRGEQLKQQRQQAGEQFLGQATPTSQREQSLAQFYQQQSMMQQRQQSLGQFSQVMDPTRMSQASYLQGLSAIDPTRMSQQSYLQGLSAVDPVRMRQAGLSSFYGMPSPQMSALGLAGTYIQPSNSLVNAENQIGGVQAPRQFGYVNPNAGLQGVQLGLQEQQAQLYNQSQSGSSNPWTNALSGAATGAQYGSIGGPYGAAGGLLVGAAAGAFGYPQYSTILLKTDVKKVGEHNGLDIVEFRYKGRQVHYRGVIAEQVREKFPEAVGVRNGYLTVDYDKLGIPMERECRYCKHFKPLTDFPKASNGAQGRRSRCLECHRSYDRALIDPRRAEHLEYHRKWNRENKERHQVLNIMSKFKCTHAEALRLHTIRKMSESCAICGESPSKRGLFIDHCHSTGKIRGLLCHNCNAGIGNFKDDPLKLQKAMVYLLKYFEEEEAPPAKNNGSRTRPVEKEVVNAD